MLNKMSLPQSWSQVAVADLESCKHSCTSLQSIEHIPEHIPETAMAAMPAALCVTWMGGLTCAETSKQSKMILQKVARRGFRKQPQPSENRTKATMAYVPQSPSNLQQVRLPSFFSSLRSTLAAHLSFSKRVNQQLPISKQNFKRLAPDF